MLYSKFYYMAIHTGNGSKTKKFYFYVLQSIEAEYHKSLQTMKKL